MQLLHLFSCDVIMHWLYHLLPFANIFSDVCMMVVRQKNAIIIIIITRFIYLI